MAEQPYDSGARIELSERSKTIVVPPLSRYARSAAQVETRPPEQPPVPAPKATTAAPPTRSAPPANSSGNAQRVMPREPVSPPTQRTRPTQSAEPEPPPPATSAAVPTVLPPRREPEPRVPFWKRITLPRLQSSPAPPATPPSLEPILERLEALEKLLADSQKATIGQLEQLEENLNRLLELEDELGLSEIRERLSLVEAGQVEIADGLHSISRNLSVLTVVIALLVAAAAFSLGVLL